MPTPRFRWCVGGSVWSKVPEHRDVGTPSMLFFAGFPVTKSRATCKRLPLFFPPHDGQLYFLPLKNRLDGGVPSVVIVQELPVGGLMSGDR